MTVSRCMRNDPKIPEATRFRIQEIAIKLGYRPDPLIQRLNTHLGDRKRSSYVGTLAWVTDLSEATSRISPQMAETFDGAKARAEASGYMMEEFNLDRKRMTGERLGKILLARGIQGVLLAGIFKQRFSLRMPWDQFSVVTIGYLLRNPQFHRIANHQLHTGRTALHALHRKGYKRIGLAITRQTNAYSDNLWLDALVFYQRSIPLNHRVPAYMPSKWDECSFIQWVQKNRPDSLISNDTNILGMLERNGFRVPGDIGYVNMDWTSTRPELSGVDQQRFATGEASVDMLTGMLYRNEKGIPKIPRVLMLEGTWVEGTTVVNVRCPRCDSQGSPSERRC